MKHIKLYEAFAGEESSTGTPVAPLPAWKSFATSLKGKGFTEEKPDVTCGSHPTTWYVLSKGESPSPHFYVQYSPHNSNNEQYLSYSGTDITKTLEPGGEKNWGREYRFEKTFPLGDNKVLGEYLTWLDQQMPKS